MARAVLLGRSSTVQTHAAPISASLRAEGAESSGTTLPLGTGRSVTDRIGCWSAEQINLRAASRWSFGIIAAAAPQTWSDRGERGAERSTCLPSPSPSWRTLDAVW